MRRWQNETSNKVLVISDKPGVAALPSKNVNAIIPNPAAAFADGGEGSAFRPYKPDRSD